MRYTALVLIALLLSGAVYAADDNASETAAESNPGDDWAYTTWDANDDGMLSEEEFYAGYEESGVYDDWDFNDDGVLDEDELGEGLYGAWDANGDGFITEDESDVGLSDD